MEEGTDRLKAEENRFEASIGSVGIDDRDYTRTAEPPRSVWRGRLGAATLVAVVAFVSLTDTGHRGLRWVGDRVDPASMRSALSDDTFEIPQDDPWKSFLAPESACPRSNEAGLTAAVQRQTALCLVNYARGRRGLPALPESRQISEWSALKAADIVRCNDFAHTACGEAGDVHARAAGFMGGFGENLFLGPQEYKTALAAVDGWLNSPRHRENLFRTGWRSQGVAVLHTDHLRGQTDVAVWVSEFAT